MTKSICINIGGPPRFDIENCELVKNSNNLPLFNLYLRYLNRSVSSLHIQGVLKKRINKSFTPALFNRTFDACLLLPKRNTNRVFAAFLDLITPTSNMDHACPYEVYLYIIFLKKSPLFFKFCILFYF